MGASSVTWSITSSLKGLVRAIDWTTHKFDPQGSLPKEALKERAPARKGIPGLCMWLACHGAVPVPLLRAPPPRWQVAPKDWIPGAVPEYLAEAVVRGRIAKTTKEETVYHRVHAPKVSTTAMKETMEAERSAPELRVCCQPPDAMPSDTRLHHLLVALLGVQVKVNAALHSRLLEDHQHVSLEHHRVAVKAAGGDLLAVGTNVAHRPGHGAWLPTSPPPGTGP